MQTVIVNRYKSWEHLICMLYCTMNNCISLREVAHGIAAYGEKLNHLGFTYTSSGITLSDANVNRNIWFFRMHNTQKQVLFPLWNKLPNDWPC